MVSTVETRNGPSFPSAARASTNRRKLCIEVGVVSTIHDNVKGQLLLSTCSRTKSEASLMITVTSGAPDVALEGIAHHHDFARLTAELFGTVNEDCGIRFGNSDPTRIHDHGKERSVTEIGAELLDIAAAIRNHAQFETALH